MREAIFILLVIAVLLGLTAFRFRRQLWTVYQVWRTLRAARDLNNGNRPEQIPKTKGSEPLVKCVKCGSWVPKSRSVDLGSAVYCSAECIEKSATPA
ncbi:MAG: hypothetical protein KF855_10415 [Acidobacteria bacterium]|nr:hypothetical protein [Acidobacteriota bacterium]